MPLHVYEGLSGRLITTIFKAKRLSAAQLLAVLKRLIKQGQSSDIYGPARAVKGLPREKTRLGNRCSHISDLCMKVSWTFGP